MLENLEPLVQQFNQSFQDGKIEIIKEAGTFWYRIPRGRSIAVSFFQPKKSGIKTHGGEIIGGGWIGISGGRSANLVLLRTGDDDLYGHWVVCEISFMALADPSRLIGRFGVTKDTVLLFGFKDAYFYDQMQYATGTLHAFTYSFVGNVNDFFAALLADACR